MVIAADTCLVQSVKMCIRDRLFGDYLWNTISIRDTAVAKDKKENFYHGILLGLLGYKASWLIKSDVYKRQNQRHADSKPLLHTK